VSAAEAIKRFRILASPFTVGDELTPTQKVRRTHVLTKLADEVNALFTPSSPVGRRQPRNVRDPTADGPRPAGVFQRRTCPDHAEASALCGGPRRVPGCECVSLGCCVP